MVAPGNTSAGRGVPHSRALVSQRGAVRVARGDSCQPRPQPTWEPLSYVPPKPPILLCLILTHRQQSGIGSWATASFPSALVLGFLNL